MKIKIIFKRYWLFILLAFLATLLIGGLILSRRLSPKEDLSVDPSSISSTWQEIEPGKTTKFELKTKQGEPLQEYPQANKEILEYASDYEFYPDKIELKSGIVNLIKEQITYERSLILESYSKNYGKPSLIAYDENLGNTYPLNIFLDAGIGVAAHVSNEVIIEIWYFKPMSKSEFLRTVGQGLSLSPLQKF